MSDLVSRLRESAEHWIHEVDTRKEAADEIERLRGALRTYGRHLDSCGDADAYNHAEVAQCGCGFDAALEGATVQPSAALTPIGIKPACAHEWFRLPSWTLGQSRCYHCGAWNTTPDPTPQPQPKAARFYGFRSEKLAEERAFHADMVFTEREQAEKVNTAPTTEDPIIHAQHDETGRTWTGPRSQLPRRYFEITSICCLDYPLCDCNSPPEPDNAPTLLTNPWNGEPRDIRDVESDPTGILMVEPGKPLRAADQPNVAPSIEWRLTTEKINDLQIDSIKRLIPLCKAAHFVNVRVRINGTWEEYQADWIKHMVRIERAADPTPAPQPQCACEYYWPGQGHHPDCPTRNAAQQPTAPTTEVQK